MYLYNCSFVCLFIAIGPSFYSSNSSALLKPCGSRINKEIILQPSEEIWCPWIFSSSFLSKPQPSLPTENWTPDPREEMRKRDHLEPGNAYFEFRSCKYAGRPETFKMLETKCSLLGSPRVSPLIKVLGEDKKMSRSSPDWNLGLLIVT